MALNVSNVATAVLLEMGVIAAGDVPSAADAAFVKGKYLQWRRNAETRDLVDWYGDDEEIPDGAEIAVTLCLCYECKAAFGIEAPRDWKGDGEVMLHDYLRDRVPAPQTAMVNM